MRKLLLALLLALVVASLAQAQTNPLWHSPKIKNYLPHMTWPEVDDLLDSEAFVDAAVQFIEQWRVLKPLVPLANRRAY